MTGISSPLRVRLQLQRPSSIRDPRQAFWQTLAASGNAESGTTSGELDDVETTRLEDQFVNAFPAALLAQIRQHGQRESESAHWWSPARRRGHRQALGIEAVRVRIVRYEGLVFDVALLGPAAHALVTDPRFVGHLTSTLIPQALANTIPGTTEDAIWVDVERGALADARPRAYGAFANLSFAVPVVFALLGFLFFAGALLQRQRLTTQYESLVQSQQTVIDTLSDELTACTDGDGSDTPAAVWKTHVR